MIIGAGHVQVNDANGNKVTVAGADLAVLAGLSTPVNSTNSSRALKIVAIPIAGGTDTGGGLLSWQNPEGVGIIIDEIIVDVTTPATGACSASFGTTSASATTSSANLIDTQDVHTAAITLDNFGTKGSGGKTNGKVAAGKWITGSTASGASAGLVGTAYISYFAA